MPPPWNGWGILSIVLPRSVIPSFCHSFIIHFPIIISTIVAHIQLKNYVRDRVFLSSNIQSYENSFRNLLKDGLQCNIYIIHCSVFTQSMVVKEFVIFEISLKKNVFRLGTGNRQMEKVKWIKRKYF